jgi:glycerophosphoryl diester phosphodiesterase
MHDDTVDRTTNGTGLVSDMTLLTIRSLDASAGKTFFTGTKVPTFDEYLQIAKGRSKYLYPEIKGVIDVTRDVKTFVDKIKAHYLEENTIVQSFTAPYLAEVRKNSSKVILGYLANTLDVFNLRMDYAEADGNAVVIVDCNILFDDPTLVEQAFSRGIELITYGTDRSRDLQQLYSYGVRRFICNDKQGVIS